MLQRPLISRHKALARTALYLAPVIFAAMIGAVIEWGRDLGLDLDWTRVDWAEFEEVRLLSEYVQIDTTNPGGDELPGAEFLARHLREMGLEVHLERLGERNANLWAVLEGRNREALVLHNHLDTDPIREPDRWLHGPFSGKIAPPHLWGRGSFDMKSVAIAQLLAMRDATERDSRPVRSLFFLATGDEETGSDLGMQYFLATRPELVERFWAGLSEGGAVEAVSRTEIKYWGTEFAQGRLVKVTVCGSSREELESLAEALEERHGTTTHLTETVRTFFRAYAGSRPRPSYRRALEDPEAMAPSELTEALTTFTRAMVRNEIYLTPVEEAPGGGHQLKVHLVLADGAEPDEALLELLPEGFAGFAVGVEVPHSPVPASSLQHPVYGEIDRLVEERYGDGIHGPLYLPWTITDSRFLRGAGVPSWGFSPFRLIASDSHKLGGVNERMDLTALVEGVALYRELVRRLLGLRELSGSTGESAPGA